MKPAKVSMVLLVIQLAIVSSIAGKYLYQRWTCPKVWTRTVVYDPEMLMRGRYLSLQLVVDGCQSTLPSAELAAMPRDKNGVQTGRKYSIRAGQPVRFAARLKVEADKLVAIRLPEFESESSGQTVDAWPGSSCDDLRLETPVDFYLPEHASNPSLTRSGQELWVEVTVPPKGPPRPLQLALKEDGVWKPLGLD
jgi:uncharacterized membrane-anchored protein